MSLAKIAAGANLFFFGGYGAALLFTPAALMREVMKSGVPYAKLNDIPYAIAQYLGAVYLSQALRMVRALTTAATMRYDLLGVGTIQLFLCLTSLGRLLAGIDKNAVTLTLPLGQGAMAALAFAGAASV